MRSFAALILASLLSLTVPGFAQQRGAGAPDVFILGGDNLLDQTLRPTRDTSTKTIGTQTINTGIQNCVIITAGQSNIFNMAPSNFSPVNPTALDNFNIYDGAIYKAADPLISTGALFNAAVPLVGGNPILRLGDALVTAAKCARVIIVPIAIGSTTVANWDIGGFLWDRLGVTIRRIKQRGIVCGGTGVVCVILWGQGEADCQLATSQAAYTASLNSVIATTASAGFVGRWLVARQSWIPTPGACAAVQNAQAAVVNGTTVFAGANGDALLGTVCVGGTQCRQAAGSDAHWSDTGSQSYATDATNGWQAKLTASGAPF